jgi:MraZ protein
MNGFLGEFEATLDPKGRFLLPSGFKKQLPETSQDQFVMNRGFEKCLSLFAMADWNPIFDKLKNLNDFDPKVREFKRFYLAGATIVELDTAGRLLVPRNLMDYAGLEKDIVLAANTNKIEIWDSGKYRQLFDPFSADKFSELARQVMGNPGNIQQMP